MFHLNNNPMHFRHNFAIIRVWSNRLSHRKIIFRKSLEIIRKGKLWHWLQGKKIWTSSENQLVIDEIFSIFLYLSIINVLMWMYGFTQSLPHEKDLTQGLSGVKLLWNQFSFSKTGYLNNSQKTSLSYYLHITRGRRDRFMIFARALARSECKQSCSGF